jgi:outer membrane autotransporter protein
LRDIKKTIMSIKSTIAALAASPFLLAGAAFAGPYVNVESNISYPDGDYSAATTDLHVGYEGALTESADFYAQIGPAFQAVDGTDGSETEFSGKVGVSVAATDSLGIYGELAGITDEASNGDDEIDWTGKIGAKFTF